MSFIVHVGTITAPLKPGKNSVTLKLSFRGCHFYHTVSCVNKVGDQFFKVDQSFDWPLASSLVEKDQLTITAGTRQINFKPYGTVKIYLRKLLQVGVLQLRENFCDSNNSPLPVLIEFSLSYSMPGSESMSIPDMSETRLFLDKAAECLQNLEEGLVAESRNSSSCSLLSEHDLTATTTSRSVKDRTTANKIMSFLKNSRRRFSSERTEASEVNSPRPFTHSDQETGPEDELCETELDEFFKNTSQTDASRMAVSSPRELRNQLSTSWHVEGLKPRDFQVCVTIIEARLTGPNIDPIVCVQVGDQKKYSSPKVATHCPYYNEYFVFDFRVPATVLMDHLIILTVYHAKKFLKPSEIFGSFKLDIGTVYRQEGHNFYHKWAVLMDPQDMLSGPKGYLQCNISAIAKGDVPQAPPRLQKEEDDTNIEANLLLPEGVSGSRQQARYFLQIHSAEDLPVFSSGVVANVRKALIGDSGGIPGDVFVQVSFAGHVGRSSVQKGSGKLKWHEQIVFAEMFPPLVRRIRIQLRSSDNLGSSVIATHCLDISEISDEGRSGFLPTFGPSYVNLYGSVRDPGIVDKTASLNEGLGEGTSYRGRLLIGLKVEVIDGPAYLAPGVSVESCLPVIDSNVGTKEEFLLFGCIMGLSMLDKKLVDKPVHLEISIGHCGVTDSDRNEEVTPTQESLSAEWQVLFGRVPLCHSTTPPIKPTLRQMTSDMYCSASYGDCKPCIFICSKWHDLRWRLYHSNVLAKIADKLETGLTEAQFAAGQGNASAEQKLATVLDRLAENCCHYLSYLRTKREKVAGMNKLDKERWRICQRELDRIVAFSRNLKSLTNKKQLVEKLSSALDIVQQIRNLASEPQDALPDILIWLLQGGKRVAYHRIPAKDLIHSITPDERGLLCSKMNSFYLKCPGTTSEESMWRIQGQVTGSFWLGLNTHRRGLLDGLPGGFQPTPEVRDIEKSHATPPSCIEFSERSEYELRCHLFQARCLLASDTTGLSDPFARVVFEGHSASTQIVPQTLNPTWDEALVFRPITIYGSGADAKRFPPTVVLEVFDYDQFGKEEYMGQMLAIPSVKLFSELYEKPMYPPSLQWYSLFRGTQEGGEILAAFELLQLSDNSDCGNDIPQLVPTHTSYGDMIFRIPKAIRPTLTRFRMEVLFWGLRDLKRVNYLAVEKPRMEVECGGCVLSSDIIPSYSKNPNFTTVVKAMELELPEEPSYWPAITLRCFDSRSFGRDTLVGTATVREIKSLMISNQSCHTAPADTLQMDSKDSVIIEINGEPALISADARVASDVTARRGAAPLILKQKPEIRAGQAEEESRLDWWSKYYASVERDLEEKRPRHNIVDIGSTAMNTLDYNKKMSGNYKKKEMRKRRKKVKTGPTFSKIKIYHQELEKVKEMDSFQDWITSYNLYRGRKTDESDEERLVGRFKGSIRICKYPISDHRDGLFGRIMSNEPVHVLVRIYVVKATELHPADSNGKADPYIFLTLGHTKINDKENYISKQLNPVFGKCFEVEALFPQESQLCVQVYDWDLVGRDDLIGETRVDLEDRFYSKHKASCGLAELYDPEGYNAWRDPMRPTQILNKLCKEYSLEGPFFSPGQIRIGTKTFTPPIGTGEKLSAGRVDSEALALYALRHWEDVPRVGCSLVPEHVEIRSLYHPDKSGIVQGKLEMWIDMFSMDFLPRNPVDISPRQPSSYELRVIIWNTEDVLLEDDAFFTGEKMSDIYVKGWLKGPEDVQSTDIHYRSLTGEGNFNWRFIFPFDYLEAEEKIVLSRKESIFAWDETELKIPLKLELQVWDADNFSADDFLGSVSLNLNSFPRGAKTSKRCSPSMLTSDDIPTVNIFKQRRVKGWWPFVAKNDNEELELTGKVEAEFHLLTAEEAEQHPAGYGRSDPNSLDKPNRPDASFVWFLNPLKSVRYILWHNHKWMIVKLLVAVLVLLLLAVFVYSLPGYIAKKLLDT